MEMCIYCNGKFTIKIYISFCDLNLQMYVNLSIKYQMAKTTFFFGGNGVWTQGFAFVKQAFYHLNDTSSLFSFSSVILEMGVSLSV
jgi:hypothetical protein